MNSKSGGDGRRMMGVLLVGIAIPVLYVLGIGPMNWLVNRDYVSVSSANVFYGTLMNLAIQENWLGQCLLAYIKLWN
jgi:hypothetical protein